MSKEKRTAMSHLHKELHHQLIGDLLDHQDIQQMKAYIQHGSVSCYTHCMNVSYASYRISRFLNLDFRAAARGGMLHDFFLYDWHKYRPPEGLHGFTHPQRALNNAKERFELSGTEEDIIQKHMWPITPSLPKTRESWVVILSDKLCAAGETMRGAARKSAALLLLILSSLQ